MKLDARNIISLSKYVALYQNSENLWGVMSTKHGLLINLPEWEEVKLDEVGNVYLKRKGSLDFPLAFSIHDMRDLNDVLEKYDRLEILEDKETHQKIMQAVVNKDADTAVKLQAPLSQEECEALDNGEISYFEMANEKFEEKLTSLLDPEWEEEEQEVEEQQTWSGIHR